MYALHNILISKVASATFLQYLKLYKEIQLFLKNWNFQSTQFHFPHPIFCLLLSDIFAGQMSQKIVRK